MSVISSRSPGQWAVLKLLLSGATPIAGASLLEPSLTSSRQPSGSHNLRDPEEIGKEKQATDEKAVTKEKFLGEEIAPGPEFAAFQ
ncbi:hypothetical protein GH733_008488 [Mirounga leonina]|nr:hypothetical protein GH733_008488 [Mirounga leonina]